MRTIKFNEYKIVRETETSSSKTQQAKTKIIQVHKLNSHLQRHQYAQLTLMSQPSTTKPFLLIEGECAYMTSQPGSYPIHIIHIRMIIVSISSRVQKQSFWSNLKIDEMSIRQQINVTYNQLLESRISSNLLGTD